MLDSSVFIDATNSSEFRGLIKELKDAECNLWTAPSVQYEFSRYANTVDEYNKLTNFIKELGVVVFNRVEEIVLDKSAPFTVALNKSQQKGSKRMSYTDSIICTLCFNYRSSNTYLLTSNHNDIPLALFDRIDVITFDVGNDIRTEGLYQLSSTKLSKMLKSL
jgi:hypothetical protein